MISDMNVILCTAFTKTNSRYGTWPNWAGRE